MDSKREGNLGHTVGVKLGRFSFVLAALFVVASFAAPADAGVQWVTKQVGWSGHGSATALASGGNDTLAITDEADSNRTVVINTSDWAWSAFTPTAGTVAANQAAIITVTGYAANAAAESLYVIVEKCFDGACARSVLAAGTWTTSNLTVLTPFGMTGPTWGTWAAIQAATTPNTKRGAAVVMFQGPLHVDQDQAGVESGSIFGSPAFRLNVIGDIGGATPLVRGARVFISYPKYVAGS